MSIDQRETYKSLLFLVLPVLLFPLHDGTSFKYDIKCVSFFTDTFAPKRRVANVVGNKGNGDQIPS